MSGKKIVNGVIGVVAGVVLLVIAFCTGSNGTGDLLNILAKVWILFGITIPAFLTWHIVSRLIGNVLKIWRKTNPPDNQGAPAKQNEAGQPEPYKSYLSIKTDFVF
jgi:hypothetical protein